ncbi:MAG TPA: class A beta-lactamase [Caulobacteraceae bacterium]|jgi:beta-lactamase class A|nr:class A beta-lactamase [Caulobacteraceae bacterium]
MRLEDIDRRAFATLTVGAALSCAPAWAATPDPELAALERRVGGRLGFAALDTGSGQRIAHRADERFPLCSTFKWLAAAAVLARVDSGAERLDRRVTYGKADLLAVSPITGAHVGEGLSVADLCAAAVTVSDNTAANLLLASLGGPAGLTRWLRAQGDAVTRLDRNEPALNSAVAGDPRDTTSPAAAVADLGAFLLGDTLSNASRARLAAWMTATRTGDKRLRAGLPKGWRVGDKTGTGAHGSSNDVAIAWPPSGKPILIAAYLTGGAASGEAREAAIADLGRLVGARFGRLR